jgi:DNA-binding NarL/FixJ family response regulator
MLKNFFKPIKKQAIMKVILIDDHPILLNGLVSILKSSGQVEILGTGGSSAEAIKLLSQNQPDIMLCDYNLPDETGLALVQKVRRIYPSVKIIILSMHSEAYLVKEILKEGIQGYVLKKDTQEELLAALEAVNAGRMYFSNEINAILMKSLHDPGEEKLLTERELEVLQLIAMECNNKQISERLFISERTVETHRKNIFRKTKTTSLVGLIKFAYANNLI